MSSFDEHQEWCRQQNARFHRTLVEFLMEMKFHEVAAALLQGGILIEHSGRVREPDNVFVEIPLTGYKQIIKNEHNKEIVSRAVLAVADGNLEVAPNIQFRLKLEHVPDENWESHVKRLLTEARGSNQGLISELVAGRDGRPVHTWNELRYASKSEIRIAQELEKRSVLFFPLAIAVRADTGNNWQDHREVDFLICENGKFGILEVAYHPDRYEIDSEKNTWFKRSGILCIQNYTAEKCYSEAECVIEEFLAILARH